MNQNLRTFFFFRVLFHSRFYYPIFAILFLDFGLTLEQFSLLNVVWAVTIVLAEVPSGALADIVGRRKLLIYASFLMVLEMLVLLLAPRSGDWVFYLFFLNRIFSGLAEAAASGADEALAYEGLEGEKEDIEKSWALILARVMKYQSFGMVVAMLLGAYFYDWENLSNSIPAWTQYFDRDLSLRIPIFLNLITALLCLVVSFRFREVRTAQKFCLKQCKGLLREAFQQVFQVACWIAKSRFVFSFLLFCVVFDSATRMFITLVSRYYRHVGIPDVYFGPLGACLAFLGVLSAPLAKSMVARWGVQRNFWILGGALLFVFVAMLFVEQIGAGIALAATLCLCMYVATYFTSYYLNNHSPTEMRATLLSYKGLATNLAYAWVGIAFAWKSRQVEDSFGETLPFFWQYFLAMLVLAFVVQQLYIRVFQRPLISKD